MLVRKIYRSFLFSCIFMFFSLSAQHKADLLIFSYNRPLQLYALLESVYRYITGIQEITVIYRCDDKAYYDAYQKVSRYFPYVLFKAQGENPASDFKPLTLQTVCGSSCDYVLFAVDDIIVKDSIDIAQCIEALRRTNAYGFYFRLGTNLCQGYPSGHLPLPPLTQVSPDIYSWRFLDGYDYWAYPNTLDMTLYRKEEIKNILHELPYCAPNSLEGNWYLQQTAVMHKKGLCYTTSKIVNIPLNIVQKEWENPHMNAYDVYTLLNIFNDGLKIHIDDLYQINNKSAHMDFAVRFTQRT